MDFESLPKNASEDDEASKIVKAATNNEYFNRGYYEYLERVAEEVWSEEGFGDALVFVGKSGEAVVIARFMDEDMYDDRGLVREGQDMTYRILIDRADGTDDAQEVRDVMIPYEIAGAPTQDLHSDDVTFYEIPDRATLMEAELRSDDAERLFADIDWLSGKFGNSLSSQRAGRTPARLRGEAGLIGVRLDSFSPFYPGDFQ